MPNIEIIKLISKHSSYVANSLKHIWLTDLLKCLWNKCPELKLHIFTSEVDDSGHDIVLSLSNTITRHIQLKSSYSGSTTPSVQINAELASAESGCVVWMFYNPTTLEIEKYLFYGSDPGQPLPSLSKFKVAKRLSAKASGDKPLRPKIRELPRSAFITVDTTENLLNVLFKV